MGETDLFIQAMKQYCRKLFYSGGMRLIRYIFRSNRPRQIQKQHTLLAKIQIVFPVSNIKHDPKIIYAAGSGRSSRCHV